jgi:hypothetical protein
MCELVEQVQKAPLTPFVASSPRKTMFVPTQITKFLQQNRSIIDVAAGMHHSYAIAECTGS